MLSPPPTRLAQSPLPAPGPGLDLYRMLVEHSVAGIFLVRDGHLEYVNPSLAKIFGFGAEEMLAARSIVDFVAPADRARVEAFCAGGKSAGGNRIAFSGVQKDDGVVDVEVSAVHVATDEGSLLVGTLIDDTGQRRALRALKDNEARLRLAELASGDAVWDWDIASGVVVWSETAHRLFRFAPGEMLPRIEWQCQRIHPDDRGRVLRSLQAMLDHSEDEVWSSEFRFMRGDGEYVWVMERASVVRNGHSTPARMVSSMVDVTDQRTAAEANTLLGSAAALMDASLNYSSTLIGLARQLVLGLADLCAFDVLTPDGDFRRVAVAHRDPSLEPILAGAPTDPARPAHLLVRRVAEGSPVVLIPTLDAPGATHGASSVEVEQLARLGCQSLLIVPMSVRGTTVGSLMLGRSGTSTPFGFSNLCLAEGLASRVAIAIELEHLYQKVQRAVRARSEMLAYVSHDLRDPLGTIQMAVHLLGEPGAAVDPDRVEEMTTIVDRSVEQMTGLIGNLLDVTTLEAGRFGVDRVSCEFSLFLVPLIEDLGARVRAAGLRFEHSVPDALGAIWIDGGEVGRIVTNLVSNAIKFSPADGIVSLRAARGHSFVEVCVADTGPGIPMAQLSSLFDGYWQARSGDHRGVGLGLTIARGIAEAHAGTLTVESRVGEGTTFCLRLPVSEPAGEGELAQRRR